MSQCLTSLTRRAAARDPTRIIRRHLSSDTKKPAHALPPHKMRALISLYHQSDTFITHENLFDRIDEAFVGKSADVTGLGHFTPGIDNLRREYEAIRQAPKFSKAERERKTVPKYNHNKGWSLECSQREWRVIEALYGVDASNSNAMPMPGLEALEEFISSKSENEDSLLQSETIQKEIEEDVRLRS